jgi:hypothetical protein
LLKNIFIRSVNSWNRPSCWEASIDVGNFLHTVLRSGGGCLASSSGLDPHDGCSRLLHTSWVSWARWHLNTHP